MLPQRFRTFSVVCYELHVPFSLQLLQCHEHMTRCLEVSRPSLDHHICWISVRGRAFKNCLPTYVQPGRRLHPRSCPRTNQFGVDSGPSHQRSDELPPRRLYKSTGKNLAVDSRQQRCPEPIALTVPNEFAS
jgi:hypothetical protein